MRARGAQERVRNASGVGRHISEPAIERHLLVALVGELTPPTKGKATPVFRKAGFGLPMPRMRAVVEASPMVNVTSRPSVGRVKVLDIHHAAILQKPPADGGDYDGHVLQALNLLLRRNDDLSHVRWFSVARRFLSIAGQYQFSYLG